MRSETFRGACRIGAAAAPFLLAMLAGLISSSPARAELQICNQMHRPLSIAIGYKSGDDWVSEGWWNIDPRDCKMVVGEDLTQRYYYYHDAHSGFVGEGYFFCTADNEFTITGDTDCGGRGFDRVNFALIDTGKQARSFTFTLYDEIDENTPIGGNPPRISGQRDGAQPAPSANTGSGSSKLDAATADSIAQLLEGWWASVEEPSQSGFIDKSVMDYIYDGEYVSTFDYRLDSSCPDGSGVDDVALILVDQKSGEQSCYGIVDLNFNELTLRFLPDGNLLHHNRVE